MVASGSPGPDRARFELTVGPRNTGRKPTVGKSSNRGYGRVQRGAGPLTVCRRGGPLRPSRVWSAASKEGAETSPFAAPVRQNNQNSQNEPGMSFVINEPYRARSGPGMVASGSPGPDRGRFELTVGPRNTGRKPPRLEKAPTVATGRLQRGGRISPCLS